MNSNCLVTLRDSRLFPRAPQTMILHLALYKYSGLVKRSQCQGQQLDSCKDSCRLFIQDESFKFRFLIIHLN